ncbi:uncharacterized protein I206_102569 [Kwoniella pini CBS 10737]|uniref:GATA-type domain-containing protein n=1 Tax=Kwoniella pini CBS 10737 TaxID=1296096 RepID=A0A1B9I5S0_9TREE|nr:uncharacterized protein I206_02920 [Kwoniella pini CBS 10737]OCF50862.1 hypothetical protein I206_02920 [Kwoniella pini CBS 10737]
MSRQNNQCLPVGYLTSQNLINNSNIPPPPSEPSTSSEATSSPYVPTPLSITSNDLILPKTSQTGLNPQYQRRVQPHDPLQSNLIHEPPCIPSTFLPSCYPESRFSSSSSPFPSGSTELTEGEDSFGAQGQAAWERSAKFGPLGPDLLEGIKLPSSASSPFIPRLESSIGNKNGIGGYQSVALMDLAGIPNIRESGLAPENPTPLYNSWSGSNRTSLGLTTWQPGPSSTSASQLSQSQPSQGYQESSTSSPISIHRQISASPHHTNLSLGGSSSNPSPRFQPYTKHQRAVSSASPATSGSMLPPPNPQQQQMSASGVSNSNTMAMGRSWSEPNLPDNTPRSAGYPGIMYANVPLPEGYMTTPPLGGRPMDSLNIGPEQFANASEVYNYILSAVPHIMPASQSDSDTALSLNYSNSASRQTFESLIDLSSESYQSLTGSTPPIQVYNHNDPLGINQKGKRRNSGSAQGSTSLNGMTTGITENGASGPKKATPKCLGCGATETPEWRRGPMGPRTLCNACGLVHMKLQRKKKKAEEKARLAAASAGDMSKPG